MAEEEQKHLSPPAPPPLSATAEEESQPADPQSDPPRLQQQQPAPPFDPSRMIGIIKRKALIKDLAAEYHAQCLSYCQQLLDLQKNSEEPFMDLKAVHNDSRKETMRPPSKRIKKTR